MKLYDISKGVIICLVTFVVTDLYSQKHEARYFEAALIADSASTVFFPIRYSNEMFSDHKIALGGDYYANILVYNYTSDSYHKLFPHDCFIGSFNQYSYVVREHPTIKNMTKDWVFLFVKLYDTNDSGRIDEKDPSILYAATTKGEKLQALTDKTENAISIQLFAKQGFALLKIQRDSGHDGSFKFEDRDTYYRKIDLANLSLGDAIELKTDL